MFSIGFDMRFTDVQVDPDAILYADRLRGHLQWHIGQFLAKEAY